MFRGPDEKHRCRNRLTISGDPARVQVFLELSRYCHPHSAVGCQSFSFDAWISACVFGKEKPRPDLTTHYGPWAVHVERTDTGAVLSYETYTDPWFECVGQIVASMPELDFRLKWELPDGSKGEREWPSQEKKKPQ